MKLLFITAALVVLFVSMTHATQNEDCHTALTDCLHDHFYHDPDEDALDRCGYDAIGQYGEASCSACAANTIQTLNMVKMHIMTNDSTDHVAEDCLVQCYHDNMLDTCSESNYISCGEGCLANFEDNADCQADLVQCFTDYYNDEDGFDTCADTTTESYGGPVNCASCFYDPSFYMGSLAPASSTDHACEAGCFSNYLNDCGTGTYISCLFECYFSATEEGQSKIAVAQKVTPTVNAQESSVAVVACVCVVALLVGVFVGKRFNRVRGNDLYDQLKEI